MNQADRQYMQLVEDTLQGHHSQNRTAVDTIKTFGKFMEFDLQSCYPLLTQKKVYHRGIHEELWWFLDGENNIQKLLDADVHIWDGWANERGDLGPVYGEQWRRRDDIHFLAFDDPYFSTKKQYLDSLTYAASGDDILCGQKPYEVVEVGFGLGLLYFRKYDQIANAIYRLTHYPDCRRIIVDGWNPSVVPVDGRKPSEQPAIGKQSLPACHTLFQFGSADTGHGYAREDMFCFEIEEHGTEAYLFDQPTGLTVDQLLSSREKLLSVARDHDHAYGPLYRRELNLHLHQRSMDTFLGGPFNIASYASMLCIFAARTGMLPAKLSISVGDAHIYTNHLDVIEEQQAQPEQRSPLFCTINIRKHPDLRGLTSSNYRVLDYVCGPTLRGEVAV